jgi:hypothetical protein
MDLIADILLVAGALGAAVYCYVLAARLKSFATLETGMGGAIAVLSAQVDDMTRALQQAGGAAQGSAASLTALTERAEAIGARLEMLVASMHDLPAPEAARPAVVEPEPAAAAAQAERKARFFRRRTARASLEAAE